MNITELMQDLAASTGSHHSEEIAVNDLHRLVNNKPVEDTFVVGTIVAWKQNDYLYAAIKTPIGWTTTAGESNKAQPQIPRTTDFGTLANLLALDKVTLVAVFTTGKVIKDTL